ncbi:MAG TPA: hypothetical protein PK031_01990 [Pseudomonadales bacterium]|nr:hypothetical protein [Pseudomonadales bacterium]
MLDPVTITCVVTPPPTDPPPTQDSSGNSQDPNAGGSTSKSNPCDKAAAGTAGDPVKIATGNMTERETIYQGVTDARFGYFLTYNSLSRDYLGGWRDSIARVGVTATTGNTTDGYVTTLALTTADGKMIKLTGSSAASTYAAINQSNFVSADGHVHGNTTNVNFPAINGIWLTLTYQDGQIDRFNYGGQLLSSTWPDGYVLSYSYAATGASSGTATITDPNGNAIIVNKQQASNGDYQSTAVSFQSVGAGSPVSVASFSWESGTGSRPLSSTTFADSTTHIYSYGEFGSPATALTGLTDETGKRYSTWKYDSSGRALFSATGDIDTVDEYGHLPNEVVFVYSGGSTEVDTYIGKGQFRTETYNYTLIDGLAQITGITSTDSVNCPHSATSATYDTTTGLPQIRIDANGSVTSIEQTFEAGIMTTQTAITGQTGNALSHAPTTESQKTESEFGTGGVVGANHYGYTQNAWHEYLYTLIDGSGYVQESDMTGNGGTGHSRVWTVTRTYYSGTTVLHTRVDCDPRHVCITRNFNTAGQLVTAVNALSQTTLYSYFTTGTKTGLLRDITDPNGTKTTFDYDVRNRLKSSTVSATGMSDQITSIEYYPNGLVNVITAPDSTVLTYSYNSARQLIGVTNQRGESITYKPSLINDEWVSAITRTSDGNITKQQNRVLDALGRVWKIQDADGNDKTVFGYDANSNLSAVIALGDTSNNLDYDDNNRVVSRAYNKQNQLISETRCPSSGTPTPPYSCASPVQTTTYTYDDGGFLASVTDDNNDTTQYIRNGWGRLIWMISPDTSTTYYEYDSTYDYLTGVYSGFDAGGDQRAVFYGYDDLGRIDLVVQYGNIFGDSLQSNSITYVYDQNDAPHGAGIGHLTKVIDPANGTTNYKYGPTGLLLGKTESPPGGVGPTLTTQYGYTNNRLTSITYPGGRTVSYTRDADHIGSMTSDVADDRSSNTLVDNLSYLPFGAMNYWHTNSDNGSSGINYIQRSIDRDGRLTQRYIGIVGAGSAGVDNEYDAYGNISAVHSPGYIGSNESYQYDGLDHLTDVIADYGHLSYTYDGNGNRQTFEFERRDPITKLWSELYSETYAYETVANRHRLTGVTRTKGVNTLRTRNFTYDAQGNTRTDIRTQTGSPPIQLDFIYNPDRQLIKHHIHTAADDSEGEGGPR